MSEHFMLNLLMRPTRKKSLISDHLPILVYIRRSPDFITTERPTCSYHGKSYWSAFRDLEILRLNNCPTLLMLGNRKDFPRHHHSCNHSLYITGRILEISHNFHLRLVMSSVLPRFCELTMEANRLVQEDKMKMWLDHLI